MKLLPAINQLTLLFYCTKQIVLNQLMITFGRYEKNKSCAAARGQSTS